MREALVMVGVVLLAVILGAVIAFTAFHRALRWMVRIGQGALPEAPPAQDRLPVSASPEAMAQANLMREAIETGARQLYQDARESGAPISMKQARADAERMLGHAPDLGGAR